MNALKLLLLLFPLTAFAAGDINTTAEILSRPSGVDVTCARQEFQDALDESAKNGLDNGTINPETDSEYDMKNWVYTVFQDPATLGAVLSCPEIIDANENDTLRFESIGYTFPNGREIVINYETQPKVLHQRMMLATKNELPSDDPNPSVSELDPHATWTNTDPAWYGIMVVQSGALRDFVGPNKNNVVSAQYIYDNIHKLYPKDMALGGVCSTRSGIHAKLDNSMVHKVLREHTAKHPKDNNNYYINGDINLKWISYLEVVATVVLTVVSWGGYAGLAIGANVAKAANAAKNSAKVIQTLTKVKNVKQYVSESVKLAKLARKADNINDMRKTMTSITKLEKKLSTLKGTKQYNTVLKELDQLRKVKADKMWKLGSKVDDINDLEKIAQTTAKETETVTQTMAKLAKEDKQVAEYVRQFNNLKEATTTLRELRAFKNARTGNAFVRTWKGAKNFVKSYRTAIKSGKKIDKLARTARHGAKSGRVRDWLFHSTMKNAGRLAKVGADLAALYFVLGLFGDFFDYAPTQNDEFTNGINLRPWLLLGADDIEGEDNVVNYGTWLRWTGDSIDPRDDDAAFLQAMDFAQKFHQDLLDVQEEDNRHACDVDIYVVRPIIRNPDREHQALYWLFMNDTPWTTATK